MITMEHFDYQPSRYAVTLADRCATRDGAVALWQLANRVPGNSRAIWSMVLRVSALACAAHAWRDDCPALAAHLAQEGSTLLAALDCIYGWGLAGREAPDIEDDA